MDITEVRIKLTDNPHDRLKAFCSITLDDCFVVRDLKVIDGSSGVFVAMPSRKIMAHCRGCRAKNHLRAAYCNDCGRKLNPEPLQRGDEAPIRLYADVAHPINAACRELIQERVLDAFDEELQRAQRPDYVSTYDDDYDDFLDDVDFGEEEPPSGVSPPRAGRKVEQDEAPRSDRPQTRRVEPPEPAPRRHSDEEPRGPHKKPPAKTASAGQDRLSRRQPPNEEFGAGIF